MADTAAAAVASLWDEGQATFWRTTEQREREGAPKQFYPTVTFVSVEALARRILDFRDWTTDYDATALVDNYLPAILAHKAGEFKSSLDPEFADGSAPNPFTVARNLTAVVLGSRAAQSLGKPVDVTELIARLADLLVAPVRREGSLARFGPAAHPYVTFHVIRALTEAARYADSDEGKQKINQEVRYLADQTQSIADSLLARYSRAPLAAGDAVALAFCGGALLTAGYPDALSYCLPILRVLIAAQDSIGSWPFGRVVALNKDVISERLEISTFEVAWIVSEILRPAIHPLMNEGAPFVDAILRAADYASSTRVKIEGPRPIVGWCTDYPFNRPLVESWTSATVLQMALSMHEVAIQSQREESLATFSVDWAERLPTWLQWEHFKVDSEPDNRAKVLSYLEEHVIEPIRRSPRHLPSPRDGSVSALLFGPPGTSKTTIVRAMAAALAWPVVMLSPGEFIARGLEYIEAEAQSVFGRLLKLSQAVVLFDECDELFRERTPSRGTEQTRGIAAFVTASMLPKLQQLHDSGRVVFVICTNHLGSMDKAVTRPGRIDHVVGIGPPDQAARLRILRQLAVQAADKRFNEAMLREIARATGRFSRAELERVLGDIRHANWTTTGDRGSAIQEVTDRLSASLAVTPQAQAEYVALRRSMSYPHIATTPARRRS